MLKSQGERRRPSPDEVRMSERNRRGTQRDWLNPDWPRRSAAKSKGREWERAQ